MSGIFPETEPTSGQSFLASDPVRASGESTTAGPVINFPGSTEGQVISRTGDTGSGTEVGGGIPDTQPTQTNRDYRRIRNSTYLSRVWSNFLYGVRRPRGKGCAAVSIAGLIGSSCLAAAVLGGALSDAASPDVPVAKSVQEYSDADFGSVVGFYGLPFATDEAIDTLSQQGSHSFGGMFQDETANTPEEKQLIDDFWNHMKNVALNDRGIVTKAQRYYDNLYRQGDMTTEAWATAMNRYNDGYNGYAIVMGNNARAKINDGSWQLAVLEHMRDVYKQRYQRREISETAFNNACHLLNTAAKNQGLPLPCPTP